MDSALSIVIAFFEEFVLGALAACTIFYLLVLFHPVRQAFLRYPATNYRLLLGDRRDSRLADWVFGIGILGFVYCLGVITNVGSSWLLKPVHYDIIHAVDAHQPSHLTWESVERQLPSHREIPTDHEDAHERHLELQQRWRNQNLGAYRHALDGLLKQSRLLRGSAILAEVWALIAGVKVVVGLLVLIFLFITHVGKITEGIRARAMRGLYSWVIETTPDPGLNMHREWMKTTWSRMLFPNALYAVCAVGLAALILASYHHMETEYHSILLRGVKSLPGTPVPQ